MFFCSRGSFPSTPNRSSLSEQNTAKEEKAKNLVLSTTNLWIGKEVSQTGKPRSCFSSRITFDCFLRNTLRALSAHKWPKTWRWPMPRSRLGSKTEERNGGEQNSEGFGIGWWDQQTRKLGTSKQRCDPLLDLSVFDLFLLLLKNLKTFQKKVLYFPGSDWSISLIQNSDWSIKALCSRPYFQYQLRSRSLGTGAVL